MPFRHSLTMAWLSDAPALAGDDAPVLTCQRKITSSGRSGPDRFMSSVLSWALFFAQLTLLGCISCLCLFLFPRTALSCAYLLRSFSFSSSSLWVMICMQRIQCYTHTPYFSVSLIYKSAILFLCLIWKEIAFHIFPFLLLRTNSSTSVLDLLHSSLS